VVAVDGVCFDPNPSPMSHIYKRVQAKFSKVLSKVPIQRKFSQVLSKFRKRKRQRNDLGKVVNFATQEVKGYSEPEDSKGREVEGEFVPGTESKDAV
jgi:hypothetical protein